MLEVLEVPVTQRWAGMQTPQLHASSDVYDQQFLKGGYVVADFACFR